MSKPGKVAYVSSPPTAGSNELYASLVQEDATTITSLKELTKGTAVGRPLPPLPPGAQTKAKPTSQDEYFEELARQAKAARDADNQAMIQAQPSVRGGHGPTSGGPTQEQRQALMQAAMGGAGGGGGGAGSVASLRGPTKEQREALAAAAMQGAGDDDDDDDDRPRRGSSTVSVHPSGPTKEQREALMKAAMQGSAQGDDSDEDELPATPSGKGPSAQERAALAAKATEKEKMAKYYDDLAAQAQAGRDAAGSTGSLRPTGRAPTAEERAKLMQAAMGASSNDKSSSFRAGGPTAEQRAQLAQMAMQQQHVSGTNRPSAEDRLKLMQAAQGHGHGGEDDDDDDDGEGGGNDDDDDEEDD